jgi:mevalonate kinase
MRFPAKIILFGEYGILLKSKALAIPYLSLNGRLCFQENSNEADDQAKSSNKELREFLQYAKNDSDGFSFLNLERLEAEIDKGIYFESSIPTGSGLGSSGAVTASLYHRYAPDSTKLELEEIRNQLAVMESKFHGVSSGIDPLTILLQSPVLIQEGSLVISSADLSSFFDGHSIFLVECPLRGSTLELVELFRLQYRNPAFKEKIDNEYLPLIALTIDNLLSADTLNFEKNLSRYSRFQLANFEKMIPENMRRHFEHGTESGDFNLKLCGSGGGGYLLAISSERERAENYFKVNHLDYNSYN